MLLIFLLVVPIVFWLIPLAGLRQQDRNISRRFVVNFSAMLLTVLTAGIALWIYQTDFTSIFVILMSISASWGALFHLISGRKFF